MMHLKTEAQLRQELADVWALRDADRVALTELQRAVEAILEDGHMNQELLARLRAAYEFGFAPETTEEPGT